METVARVGGDEFVVLITKLQHRADARVMADKLKTVLNQPFELNGKQYSTRVSIGIAVFPDDGEQPEQLLNHADSAMYEAKKMTKLSVASLWDLIYNGSTFYVIAKSILHPNSQAAFKWEV